MAVVLPARRQVPRQGNPNPNPNPDPNPNPNPIPIPHQVCWQEEDLAKNLNFFSISSDGRVTLWTLAKSELEDSDIMQVTLPPNPNPLP